MSDYDSIGFFGHPDARFDRQYFKQFEPTEAFENAKKEDGGSKYFITGVFGSGKSTVRYRIQDTVSDTAFVWSTDELNPPEQVLDFNDLRRHTGSMANVTLNSVLWELSNRILAHASEFPSQAIKKLKEVYPSIIDRFLMVASVADLQDPFGIVRLDLQELLKNKGGTLAKTLPIEDWRQALLPCLSSRPVFILLDDVELIFPGLDEIPEAADGLLYACELLNDKFRDSLTCLVFLQWSAFMHLQRSSRRFERVISRMERIKWSREQLKSLLASRVRERLNLSPETTIEEALSSVFDFKSGRGLNNLINEATSLCVNGPRDLIAVCNSAYEAAGGGAIAMKHIREIKPDFGDMKLFGIEREFDVRYPFIRQFIERSFTGEAIEYTPYKLETHLSGLLPSARDIYGNKDWLTAASRQVVEVLFEVGFLGYRATASSKLEYVINQPFAHRRPGFHTSAKLVVHPAFRARLGLKPIRKPTRKKQKSG